MRRYAMLVGVMVLFTLIAESQQKPKVVAEGGTPDDRASARVLYWNAQTNSAAGQWRSITAGRFGGRNTTTPPSSMP